MGDDVLRSAAKQLASKIQNEDVIAQVEDHVHDMLDHDDRCTGSVDAPERGHHVLDLVPRQTAHDLVKQNELRLRRKHAGKLKLLLAAQRQSACQQIRLLGQAN